MGHCYGNDVRRRAAEARFKDGKQMAGDGLDGGQALPGAIRLLCAGLGEGDQAGGL